MPGLSDKKDFVFEWPVRVRTFRTNTCHEKRTQVTEDGDGRCDPVGRESAAALSEPHGWGDGKERSHGMTPNASGRQPRRIGGHGSLHNASVMSRNWIRFWKI